MVTNGKFGQHEAGARTRWDGTRTIVWLWGEHDLATADRLTRLLDTAAEGNDLVVDLSAVSFMDASTISAIVRARSSMAEHSQVLTVRSPSALMERVFGVCGLEGLIERAEAPKVQRARSALESWVAVKACDPAPSGATPPVPEEAVRASRDR